jgi:hypothetical protein
MWNVFLRSLCDSIPANTCDLHNTDCLSTVSCNKADIMDMLCPVHWLVTVGSKEGRWDLTSVRIYVRFLWADPFWREPIFVTGALVSPVNNNIDDGDNSNNSCSSCSSSERDTLTTNETEKRAKNTFGCRLLPLGLLFDSDDGGSVLLRNIAGLLPDYTALHPSHRYRTFQSTKRFWTEHALGRSSGNEKDLFRLRKIVSGVLCSLLSLLEVCLQNRINGSWCDMKLHV